MNSDLQLGPFVLKLQWLVIILSVIVGYFVARYRLKRITGLEEIIKERIIEAIEKSIVIALLTWKFSFILSDPLRVLTNPLSILYYSGGELGIGLAMVVLFLYFYYHSKKEHILMGVYGDLIAAGSLAGMMMYSLFALLGNQQTVGVYGSQILLVILLFQLYFRKDKGTANLNDLNQVLIWFSLGQVFIAFLSPLKRYFWLGFSELQIIFLILAAFCIIIEFWWTKNRAD